MVEEKKRKKVTADAIFVHMQCWDLVSNYDEIFEEGRKLKLLITAENLKQTERRKPVWNDRASENEIESEEKKLRLPLLWCIMNNINFIFTKLLHLPFISFPSFLLSLALLPFPMLKFQSLSSFWIMLWSMLFLFRLILHISSLHSSHISWTPARVKWEDSASAKYVWVRSYA